MKKKHSILILSVLLFSFASCSSSGDNENGSDDDNGGSGGPIVDDSGILTNLRSTNLNSDAFPWNSVPDNDNGCDLVSLTDGKLKRWDIGNQGPIPVKINGLPLVPESLDLIEERLGLTLFDRTSIANTADENIERGIIFAAEEETDPFGYSFDNSYGCGGVSFQFEQEYFYEDIELEYDEDENVIGYDYPVLGQAFDGEGNVVGSVLDGTPYIFNDEDVVVGILLEEDRLMLDGDGNAICTWLYSDPLYNEDGHAIGATVSGAESGYFMIQGETIETGYYDAAGRINGLILVRLDTMECQFSDDEDEIEMIVNKLGYALDLGSNFDAVSYTHLTLPTILRV